MKRNIWGTLLILVGVISLLGAAGLAMYNLNEEHSAGESSQSVLEELMPQVTQPPVSVPSGDSDAPEQTLPPQELQIPNYILNPNMDLPEKESGGRQYVGILTIPALGLELPVLNEWSTSGAKIAPCRYTGTPYLQNMVICAHNYNSHFGRLNTLKTGDIVYFTDMDGNVFSYAAATFEILQPNQKQEMCDGKWDLTLFTCTIGGQTRFVVRFERTGNARG